MHLFILHLSHTHNLHYRELPGDGNSLYRALAISLKRGENAYQQIKNELIKYQKGFG